MTNLAEFLLARIAEDEAAAHNAGGRSWVAGYNRDTHAQLVAVPGGDVTSPWKLGPTVFEAASGYQDEVTHSVKWDPARVLAECEAKWRILAEHSDELDHGTGAITHTGLCPTCGEDVGRGVDEQFPCTTLRALALPYSDHPDFREEWKL